MSLGRIRVWFLAGAVALAMGCERLPWFSRKQADETAPAPAASRENSPTVVTPPVPATQLLAKVNQVPISQTDLDLRLQEFQAAVTNQGQTWTPLSHEQLQQVRDGLISEELMAQEVLARGLDRDAQIQRRMAYIRRAFLAQEWIRWQQARLEVSPEEIEQHYEQFKMGFREPEQLRVRLLVVETEAAAKQALVDLLGGAEFSTLTQQASVGPARDAGGLLEKWVMRADDRATFAPDDSSIQSLDPVLEQAAFAIDQDGGISSYVKGPDGRYAIFQRVERKPPVYQSLTDVWDDIRTLLLVQKLNQAAEQLQAQAQIERFEERLEGLGP